MAALFVSLAPGVARAQCPDGTPPPCHSAATVSRRAAPALSDRMWIVVPFTNVTRAPDLEWLRDASVNLLSLDLGRWTDIGVVDDKRVADLLRTLPVSRAAQALSLGDGIALARQAGAGRLVMGDFIKVGRGTRLVANVFEVRSGTRLRSVQQPVPDPDSLLSAFGPLARAVLAVAPPRDASVGATGTTSADAYREYLAGLASLHQFELTNARRHLLAALKFDSTFALAHYKLSIAMHWTALRLTDAERARGSDVERAHAVAAARLGGALPPRERALISSRLASSSGDPERACTTLATLVQHDSLDVEALYALGDCRFHAGYLPPEPTADTTRGRFRGDWNGAIAAFRRVLVIDPSYHPAFEHVIDMLATTQVTVCAVERPGCGNDLGTYAGWVIRDADTLLIQPVRGNSTVKTPMRARQDSTRSPLLNLREARRIAREWADAGPGEARAHLNLAKLDMQLGELAAAKAELALIPANGDATARTNALEARVQVAIMLGEGDAGRAALDTLSRELPDDSTKALRIGGLEAPFGRVHPMLAAIDAYGASQGWSAERRTYARHRPYAMLGVPLASMAEDERRYGQSIPGDTLCAAGRPRCRSTELFFTMAYLPRVPRAWSPYNSRGATSIRFFGSHAIWLRDTSYERTVAELLDSLGTASRRSGNDDLAIPLHASEIYLALGDSLSALRATRTFTDSTLAVLARISTSNDAWEWPYLLSPRMMKQRGDLAARMGYPDEARGWYERVLSLWSDADPEFKPEVDRVRAALAATTTKR
ncbi:MAG: putative serine/threonine protein kinase [Gemmatimonadetes bacterium]|nr:putative serine/threonine protein kinase [Gemmatimonadota bacterium]